MSKRLNVVRTLQLPPHERGPLREAHEIATLVYNNKVEARWVREHVPHQLRNPVGRLVLFYEGEVRAWQDTQRSAA